MAVRPIDGNELYRIEKLLDTDIVRQDKVALNLLEQVLYDIQHVPTLTPPNEPLTIEQLREMNETPIYVVTETYGSGWCILNWHGVNKSYTYFSRTGTPEGMTATPLSAKTYGDLWTAYRRPPEGAEIQPSKQARAGALCGIQII